jgi:hypothetical protein
MLNQDWFPHLPRSIAVALIKLDLSSSSLLCNMFLDPTKNNSEFAYCGADYSSLFTSGKVVLYIFPALFFFILFILSKKFSPQKT